MIKYQKSCFRAWDWGGKVQAIEFIGARQEVNLDTAPNKMSQNEHRSTPSENKKARRIYDLQWKIETSYACFNIYSCLQGLP